jgi:hypothetical protein
MASATKTKSPQGVLYWLAMLEAAFIEGRTSDVVAAQEELRQHGLDVVVKPVLPAPRHSDGQRKNNSQNQPH